MSLLPASGGGVGDYDKLAHGAAYAVFAWVVLPWARSPANYLGLCLLIVFYGGLMEVGQAFVPGRDMSGADMLANGLGVTLGAGLAQLVLPRVGARP